MNRCFLAEMYEDFVTTEKKCNILLQSVLAIENAEIIQISFAYKIGI